MINPHTVKELLLAAGAIEVSDHEDPQSLYDLKLSGRHRIHVAFDELLETAKTVTVSLITIDRPIRKEGDTLKGIDIHRVGQWSVDEFVGLLQEHGSFIAKLLPFKTMFDLSPN